MKINSEIIKSAADYVADLFSNKLSPHYLYHSRTHTNEVVSAVNEIAKGMHLEEEDKCILVTAALFHDIGYIWQQEEHEKIAADLAEKFLVNRFVDEEQIEKVRGCILATKYPQHPSNILEQVICDADLMHVGTKDFFEKTALIREEWRLTLHKDFTEQQWHQINIDFMQSHTFHTTYCKKNYNKRKGKNIEVLNNLLLVTSESKTQKKNNSGDSIPKNTKANKPKSVGRGVETLFKLASRNHMQLSSMADSKAHILLSINSILISIIISVLLKKVEQSLYLAFPTALLLCVCLASLVFAILTTQPKVSKGIFTKEQVSKREANLLFFGNFHNMDLDTYHWGVKEIMHDEEYLYSSITRDVYFLGKVLAIKYRYLNYGYRVFMFGLIVSVLAFGVSFFYANHL